jgi:hypothetical protein
MWHSYKLLANDVYSRANVCQRSFLRVRVLNSLKSLCYWLAQLTFNMRNLLYLRMPARGGKAKHLPPPHFLKINITREGNVSNINTKIVFKETVFSPEYYSVQSRCHATTARWGGYTMAVFGQRPPKHVCRSNTHESNRRTVFSMWSLPRCYEQGTRLELSQFPTGVCEERTSAGDRGIAIVGAVTRKRLVTDWEHWTVCSSEL